MSKLVKDAENTTRETFSLYPSTVTSLRSLAGHFGSIGRAIQIAVELLYQRAQQGELHSGKATDTAERKVPFSFFVLPRTKRLIEWLSDEKRYGSRNNVLSVCDELLYNLYAHFYGYRMTAKEQERETETVRNESKPKRVRKKASE